MKSSWVGKFEVRPVIPMILAKRRAPVLLQEWASFELTRSLVRDRGPAYLGADSERSNHHRRVAGAAPLVNKPCYRLNCTSESHPSGPNQGLLTGNRSCSSTVFNFSDNTRHVLFSQLCSQNVFVAIRLNVRTRTPQAHPFCRLQSDWSTDIWMVAWARS